MTLAARVCMCSTDILSADIGLVALYVKLPVNFFHLFGYCLGTVAAVWSTHHPEIIFNSSSKVGLPG